MLLLHIHLCACYICVMSPVFCFVYFFFNDTATPEIYTLSLHDALPISAYIHVGAALGTIMAANVFRVIIPSQRSEEHTSELQSLRHLVCRLLLEKKKKNKLRDIHSTPNQQSLSTLTICRHTLMNRTTSG